MFSHHFYSLFHSPAHWATLTWPERLEVPGAAAPARLYGGGQGGVAGTAGLDVDVLVAGSWDFQHGNEGALVQQALRGQHLCVALLAHAQASLQGAVEIHSEFYTLTERPGRASLLVCRADQLLQLFRIAKTHFPILPIIF